MNARITLTIATSLIAGLWPNLALSQLGAPVGPGTPAQPKAPPPAIVAPLFAVAQPFFYVQSYLGKCLDFGTAQTSGTQVYVSDCNNSAEQQVLVEEVDAQHDVILHAGSLVLGLRPPQVLPLPSDGPAAPASPVYVLELQALAKPNPVVLSNITPASQTFALDGDSIILASDHTLVVQVQNSLGANGSPLVVAKRSLADSEFWDFIQIDGFGTDPTSGFVRAGYPGSTETAYDTLLSSIAPWNGSLCQNASPACTPSPAAPGTVIQIYPGTDIDLSGLHALQIPSGVTIRGSRRGTLLGPLLHQDKVPSGSSGSIFEVATGDTNVRITGLRLQGISDSTAENQPGSYGVLVDPLTVGTIVDHNDLSSFTLAAVNVTGTQIEKEDTTCEASESSDPLGRAYDAFIARNFFHHNEMQNRGYGVGVAQGAFPLVYGNMFYLNRHAIAADGWTESGYRAWYNLVLEDSPEQYKDGVPWGHTHDFDMHGTNPGGFGGRGGDYVQIDGNTFLGTNRSNFEIRALPCNPADFNGNVSLESTGSAVSVRPAEYELSGPSDPGDYVETNGNYFNSPNPTNSLGVGDFDGDGVQDLFLATGSAWYYAPQGAADWRFLSAKTNTIGTLIFGDFDGDGRTDVATLDGNTLLVSWGGVSDWEYLNTVNASSVADLAVGKFGNHAPGDRRDDILWTNGTAWFISSGGTAPFTLSATSSARVPSLRFGDFDANGTTDVLGIIAGKWMVSYNATSNWTPLPKSLTGSMDGVVVADFDGDGRADIATSTAVPVTFDGVLTVYWTWQFSSAGATDWTYRYPQSGNAWPVALSLAAAIGNFAGNHGADVLIWGNDEHVYIVPGGSVQGPTTLTMYSREDLQ